jgi:hypothetical protein
MTMTRAVALRITTVSRNGYSIPSRSQSCFFRILFAIARLLHSGSSEMLALSKR